MRLDELTVTRYGALGAGLILLLCSAGASAQMFKWVDAKGVVHYSDTPPAGNEKKIELKTASAPAAGAALPYQLAEAVKNSPVTLYSTGQCDACDQGRRLLQQRGIPFAEKTVNSNADQKKLKEAGSAGQLPLLLVGRQKLIGFETGGWNEALDTASYPAQAMLPRGYQPALAEAAAPPVVADSEHPPARPSAEFARPAPPPRDPAPPGFQF